MLGELIGEATGQITGMRVLSADPANLKVEISMQGSGTMFGQKMTEMGTYTQTLLPDPVGTLVNHGRDFGGRNSPRAGSVPSG